MEGLWQSLAAPTVLGITIQTIGSVFVALISRKAVGKMKSKGKHREYAGWAIAGVAAAVTFVLSGVTLNLVTPEPVIRIAAPLQQEPVTVKVAASGEGYFAVSGTSERVHNNQALRVYVLVHPDKTPRSWYIQPAATTEANGNWHEKVQIGNITYPPEIGDAVEIVAVAADPSKVGMFVGSENSVSDPKDLNPVARSNVLRTWIGSTEVSEKKSSK